MKYDSEIHHRRSTRLRNYDYSQPGAYLITLCAHNRKWLFGKLVDGVVRLNKYGEIAEGELSKSSRIRSEVELDEFIIMPDHIHAIVMINIDSNTNLHIRAKGPSPQQDNEILRMKSKSLSSFISGYKSTVTKQINQLRAAPGSPVWQRNYYERIVRKGNCLNDIRQYIINNPLRWEMAKRQYIEPNLQGLESPFC